ncbi:MAG: class I SAM-dependent methyltransferase [Verrucomicrobiae bacterium]|nr:class I SAM-dependent methyltransferase [Verrucomicrobiae bacterium]
MSPTATITRDCPLCGASGAAASPFWQKADLRVVRCPDCGLLFVNPAPAAMAEGAFYDSDAAAYYLSPAKLESDYAGVRFERELRLFRRYCQRGAVLDVGCSTGAFLFQLQQRWPGQYTVLGTDVSGPALDYAASRGVPVARGAFLELDFGGRRFDAITFWAVLEHLAEPRRFLERARALLAAGGWCFALVPNRRSLALRCLGARSRTVYPQHLNYFDADALRELGRRAGLEPRATHFTHFNPLAHWQDWRRGGRPVPEPERAALLQRTTAWKQNPRLQPVGWLYRCVETLLAAASLADNVTIVFQKTRSDSGP